MPLVSVIVPVLRDTDELSHLLRALGEGSEFEIIVSNGDESDQSIRVLLEDYPAVRWHSSSPGRANQMNAGSELATGRWLLFLHADSRPMFGWLEEIKRIDINHEDSVGGAFKFRFRHRGPIARLIEYGVLLRVEWCGLPYGDQGIFVRRDVFQKIGGYAELPIMEDVDLVERLCRQGQMVWSSFPVEVSARRWEHDGWLRRTFLNLLLLGLFYGGVSPPWLARRYYGREKESAGLPIMDENPETERVNSGGNHDVVVIIPALDEQDAITKVLEEIPSDVDSVTVVDNGSTDETAARAASRGAHVVFEPRRGYGRACSTGLRANLQAEIVVFLDADCSDDPGEMPDILEPVLSGSADLVIGCRGGVGRPVSARVGTWLCVSLINLLWGTRYQDLGPFRAIRRETLERLGMVDKTWGWTIEMQVKASEAGLRVVEVPVGQRPRVGNSKISGTVVGTIRAGTRMLAIIFWLWWTRRDRSYA